VLRAASTAIAIAVAIAALASGDARAAPEKAQPADLPQERVVLADPDPELLRAIQSALAPWKLEVVVDDAPPADATEAEERAVLMNARFVVWRRGGALVVYDHERDSTEERATTKGPLDAVGAAAAPLSVKTLMRLPAPPPPAGDGDGDGNGTGGGAGGGSGGDGGSGIAPPARPGPELRAQAAIATRVASGSSTELGGRLVAAVLVRPLPRHEWRLGLAGDLGSSASVQRAGFKGTWSDWAVLVLTGWTIRRGAWELEPQLGAGVTRSSLEGSEMSGGRNEYATLGLLRAGTAVRRRFGRWALGAAVGADWTLSTPTYTRIGSTAEIFKVPAFAMALGVLAAADFGGSSW
jgi:hypothetical protein